MGLRVRNEELGESKEMVRYLLTLVHQWLGEFLAEDVDIDKLGQFTSALFLKLCPEGIDRCECANKNGTFTQGPFDFDEDPISVSLMQLTCNPDFCYCKVRNYDISHQERAKTMKKHFIIGIWTTIN